MAMIALMVLAAAALVLLDPPRARPARRDDSLIRRVMRLEP